MVYTLRAKHLSTMDKYMKTIKLFTGKEKPLSEMLDHLSKFVGGSVDLTQRDDGLAFVTINHTSKKNAFSGKMMVDLLHVVEKLESWKEGKGVLLYGEGENFCSGGDLNFARQTGTAEEGFLMSCFMHSVLSRFERLPLISVALIEGSGALGGGAELSIACDYRLIAEKCQGIGFVHAKMGIIPAWGGATRLVTKLGYKTALDLLCTSRIVNASESIRLGLVDCIIPEEYNCKDYAISWLQDKVKFESEIVRAIKAVSFGSQSQQESFEQEKRIFAPFWGGSANKEALSKNIKHKTDME